MNQPRLSIALRCRSFDDFPTHLSAQNSASLLKCWTALWHPTLILFSKYRPDIWSFCGGDEADGLTDRLNRAIVVPQFVVEEFKQATERIEDFQAVCRDASDLSRQEIVDSLATSLQIDPTTQPRKEADRKDTDRKALNDLAEDFFALGYAWLQVRLMTLRVRYSTNLDDELFDVELIEAAAAWTRARSLAGV